MSIIRYWLFFPKDMYTNSDWAATNLVTRIWFFKYGQMRLLLLFLTTKFHCLNLVLIPKERSFFWQHCCTQYTIKLQCTDSKVGWSHVIKSVESWEDCKAVWNGSWLGFAGFMVYWFLDFTISRFHQFSLHFTNPHLHSFNTPSTVSDPIYFFHLAYLAASLSGQAEQNTGLYCRVCGHGVV